MWRQEKSRKNISDEEWQNYEKNRVDIEARSAKITQNQGNYDFPNDPVSENDCEAISRFKEDMSYKKHFQSHQDSDKFLKKLEEGILTFQYNNDGFYSVSSLVRIYSPVTPGNFIDAYMFHHYRMRFSWTESQRSIICVKGTVRDCQATTRIEKIQKKGELDVKETLIGVFYDEENHAEDRKFQSCHQFRKHIFGNVPVSDRRFMFFLCGAVGLANFSLDDNDESLEDDNSQLSSVRKMIKRTYAASEESDNDQDSDLDDEESNQAWYSEDENDGDNDCSDSEDERS
jgi:hypothetical protein